MSGTKLSRRRFFEKSFCLSAIPLAFSSLSSLSVSPVTLKVSSFSHLSAGTGVPELEKLSGLLKLKDPLIWVFTGDSITHGAKHTQGYRSYPEVFGERIRWELGRTRDVVINTGISGNTTQVILDDFDWRIGQFKPAVVSLMIGTNDCASGRNISIDLFESNLGTLLDKIRKLNSIPIFHTPNIIISAKSPERARLSEYVSVIRSVAGRNEVILVDNYSYWGNACKSQGEAAIFKKWLNDPLHPNGAGHSEIARLMFRELSIFDPTAASCGGPYYEGEH
jgi:acyl-CoA thioesterase I